MLGTALVVGRRRSFGASGGFGPDLAYLVDKVRPATWFHGLSGVGVGSEAGSLESPSRKLVAKSGGPCCALGGIEIPTAHSEESRRREILLVVDERSGGEGRGSSSNRGAGVAPTAVACCFGIYRSWP